MYLYATDYDGTVTYHGVTPALRDALKCWKEAGHLFGVVSGRPYDSIYTAVKKEELPVDFLIANNGAVIADGADRILDVTAFDAAVLPQLIARLAAEPHAYFRMDAVRRCAEWRGSVPQSSCTDGTVSVDGEEWRDVTEITIDYPDYETSLASAEGIERAFPGAVRALLPGKTSVDCIPVPASKANAIRRVTELLGVSPARIFTTGDSHNDLDMLTCPDFEGYAVENALESVRTAVGRTTADPLALLTRILETR